MLFLPKDALSKLEFDKVLDLAERECLGDLGREALHNQPFSTDFHEIDRWLREVRELKLALEKNDRSPLVAYAGIESDLKLLAIDGYVLPVEAWQRILTILYIWRDLWRWFGGQKKEIYSRLFDIVRPFSFDEGLVKAINQVFDEKGQVRPDASPELQKIRREMSGKLAELDRKFKTIVVEMRQKGWLADTPESIRNGRRVLVVPAEHKRKVRGILHDESDTGRTAYIEPDGVIDVNNDIFDLEQAERREIYRILKELSATIRPYSNVLFEYEKGIVRLDAIQAKARLAVNMKAGMPVLHARPIFSVKKALHPLLFLKNKEIGRKTIPFELRLTDEGRILVLSGPNAGGKSVTMKSVGLIQIMLQNGFLVPVSELSDMGVFSKIMADIGDQQSLEDDLSTFSSRLQNAREFLKNADFETLILIDEMGSGTDPKPGGALAEAVLRELHKKEVFGVVTTHYSALKVLAFRTKGLLNGHMNFDQTNLSPTYELKVGRPGSSYAFEIASKNDLPRHILDYARSRLSETETAVDDILVELQKEKQELEEQLLKIYDQKRELTRLIKNYDQLSTDLELGKKRLRVEQKEHELRVSAGTSREIEQIVKSLKGEKNEAKARDLAATIKKEREQLVEKVDELHADLIKTELKLPENQQTRPASKGDFVRLRSGGATGRIEEIKGQKAIVLLGGLTVTMPVRDLILADEPQPKAQTVYQNVDRAAVFSPEIDIRGLSKEEALEQVEDFVDKALMNSSSNLRILHGKGNGILRNAVKQKLREYGKAVGAVRHPEPEQGGDGVTLVDLA